MLSGFLGGTAHNMLQFKNQGLGGPPPVAREFFEKCTVTISCTKLNDLGSKLVLSCFYSTGHPVCITCFSLSGFWDKLTLQTIR